MRVYVRVLLIQSRFPLPPELAVAHSLRQIEFVLRTCFALRVMRLCIGPDSHRTLLREAPAAGTTRAALITSETGLPRAPDKTRNPADTNTNRLCPSG